MQMDVTVFQQNIYAYSLRIRLYFSAKNNEPLSGLITVIQKWLYFVIILGL